ncbi:hypothetical protein, partial [Pseudophaeobacter sp.]|uniref:hypothetical protein n=1 Tax=Pseudophaeobacter sp. TaxID=1971739 RepID=UPI0032979BFF
CHCCRQQQRQLLLLLSSANWELKRLVNQETLLQRVGSLGALLKAVRASFLSWRLSIARLVSVLP